MNTNILLIVIIVLLTLGLFLQLFQLVATYTIPERFIDLFLELVEADPDKENVIRILDVDDDNQSEEKSNKGFGKSKKSKRSKRQWATKIVKVPIVFADREYLYGGTFPPYPPGAVFNKYLLIPLRSIRKYSSQTALEIGY